MNNWRWLWTYIKLIKWGYLLGLLLVLIETLSRLTMIGIDKWIIDDVFVNGRYGNLVLYMGIFVVSFLSVNVFSTLSAYVINYNQTSLYLHMSRQLMEVVYKIPFRTFQNERTAKYVNYFTNDVFQNSVTVSNVITRGIQQYISLAILVIIIGAVNVYLLAAILIFSIVYSLLGKYFSQKLRMASRDVQDRKAELLVHLEEGVSATREVVAYHRHEWETKRYQSAFQTYFAKVMKEGKWNNFQMLASDPLKWAGNLLVLAFGGYSIFRGSLSIGTFVILYQYNSQLMASFSGAFSFTMNLSSSLANIDRICQVMNGEQIGDGALKLRSPVSSLQFHQVSFKYEDNLPTVIDNLTIDIPIGKKVAFVGSSGGGKSTISQLLIRFYEPTGGAIQVNGIQLNEISRENWQEKITIVFQDPYLFPDSVRNNLRIGREHIDEHQMRKACELANIHDYIDSLPQGYGTEIGERGIMLSGGQKQRLALARAILENSEILILDEATSSLDLETERMVQQQLDDFRHGRTTIIIAHRLSTVQNADVIFVMDQGKVAEQGTHAQLMNNDSLYKKLVYAQEGDDKALFRTVLGKLE